MVKEIIEVKEEAFQAWFSRALLKQQTGTGGRRACSSSSHRRKNLTQKRKTQLCPGSIWSGRRTTESEDSGEALSISLEGVSEVVKKFHIGKEPAVDEICLRC